jgi:hypothetical protein
MHYPILPAALFVVADAVAAANPAEWWQPLIQTGAIGGVLLWFMLRVEKRLDAQTRASNRLARAVECSTRAHLTAFAALKTVERLGYKEMAEIELQKQDTDDTDEDSDR